MEAAIAEFLKPLEVQGRRGNRYLEAILSRVPIPRKVDQTGVSITAAMEEGMLLRTEDKEERHLAPAEVLL